MPAFKDLFQQRMQRLQILRYVRKVMERSFRVGQSGSDIELKALFAEISGQIPEVYQTDPKAGGPEYRLVVFQQGFILIALVAELESFFADVIAEAAMRRPSVLEKQSIEVGSLSGLASIPEAIELAARKFSSDLMFKRPNEYKKHLLKVVNASETLIDAEWPVFVEAKARRDLGVHNNWMPNDMYRDKVREVGGTPASGATLIADADYLWKVEWNCLDLMMKLSGHCDRAFTSAGSPPPPAT